jgi:serine/threonine protein kinase
MEERTEAEFRLGDFQVIRLLGKGGMGVVHLAKQVSVDRLVALKVLGPVILDTKAKAVFDREATAVARLDHPGIARIYTPGEDKDYCFIAFEYIDGVTIMDMINYLKFIDYKIHSIDTIVDNIQESSKKSNDSKHDQSSTLFNVETDNANDDNPTEADRLPQNSLEYILQKDYINFVCNIGIEAAEALAHAHSRGVIHRDIKPSNIMLDKHLHIRIIDFGISRYYEDNTFSSSGHVLGTPEYMSPEHIAGKSTIDCRSDIYCLGVVLYELLTLNRPISASTLPHIYQQISVKPPRPIRWQNKAVPSSLEAIVHKAMAKDPEDRYQNGMELVNDLRSFMNGGQIIARNYRYKPSIREISIDRPAAMQIISVACGALSVIFFMYLSSMVLDWLFNTTPMSIAPFRMKLIMCTSSLIITIFMAWNSIAVMRGRVFPLVILVAFIYLYLLGFLYNFISNRINHRFLADKVVNFYFYAVIISLVLTNVYMTYSLLKRETRQWLSHAKAIRKSHKRPEDG